MDYMYMHLGTWPFVQAASWTILSTNKHDIDMAFKTWDTTMHMPSVQPAFFPLFLTHLLFTASHAALRLAPATPSGHTRRMAT